MTSGGDDRKLWALTADCGVRWAKRVEGDMIEADIVRDAHTRALIHITTTRVAISATRAFSSA
jgi:hypothetical protein